MSDTSRFTDWSPETVEMVAAPPPPPPPDPDAPVVYEENQAIAYFDADGNSVKPSLATWAKVWTFDSEGGGTKLEIIALDQAPISG